MKFVAIALVGLSLSAAGCHLGSSSSSVKTDQSNRQHGPMVLGSVSFNPVSVENFEKEKGTGVVRDDCNPDDIASAQITKVDVAVENDELSVVLNLNGRPVPKERGVRIYQLFFDVNPAKDKIGYQPFKPDSILWPDFYADERLVQEFNTEGRPHSYKYMHQRCRQFFEDPNQFASQNCEHIANLNKYDFTEVKDVKNHQVVFKKPLSALGLKKGDAFHMVINGWYKSEDNKCEIETDAPWNGRTREALPPFAFVIAGGEDRAQDQQQQQGQQQQQDQGQQQQQGQTQPQQGQQQQQGGQQQQQ